MMMTTTPNLFQHPSQRSEVVCRRDEKGSFASSSRTRSHYSRSTMPPQLSRPWKSMLAFAVTFAVIFAHVVEANQGNDDAPFKVKAIAGNSVDLPCDVDLSSCGDVHSVKVYKNGVRVYLLNLHTEDKTPEGDLAVPNDRADFLLSNTPPVLHVDPVYLLDEGLYKCEATFLLVTENCKTIYYSSLTTLSRPSPPEIRFDDGPMVNMTRIGPFVEGTKLTLECKAPLGKPVAHVTWWNGSESMAGEFPDAEEAGTGVSTIDVTLDRSDLHSRFECRAMNDALDRPLVSWIDVDVHVRPLSIDILGVDGPVREGDQVTLTCVVTGARPAATIEWLNDTIEVTPAPLTEVSEEEAGFTSTTRSAYTFMASRFDNGRKIRCRSKNSIMEKLNEEPKEEVLTLEVYYPPQVVMAPEGTMVVNYTNSVELECQYDANPMNLTSVVWLRDGEAIARSKVKEEDENDGDAFRRGDDDDDDDDDSDDEFDDDDDDDVDEVPRLILQKVSHKHTGEYTCKLTNDVGFGFSTTSLRLEVNYPPVMEIKIIPESVPEREEANVTLECDLIKSNPPELFGYAWLRNGETIAETDDNDYVLETVDRNDTANYSCKAKNIYGFGEPSEEKELLVQYPPGPSYITFTPPIVIKGYSAEITCNTEDLGQPPARQYRWYRNDIQQAAATGATMVIKPVTLAALSNFTCAPFNIIGEGPEALVNIPLRAAPSFVQQLPETHGELLTADNVSLSCHVECFPMCAPITWYRNDRPLEPSKHYDIKESILPLDYSTNTMDSVLSTLTWSLDDWREGQLSRDSANANFTCKSQKNLFGPEVSNTTVFRVEYPPEDIRLSLDVVDVDIGKLASKVTCKVNAYPLPSFVWTSDKDVDKENPISGTNTLRLTHRITKEDAGNYTCTAMNRHGSINATTMINVRYIDEECHIEKELTQDGRVVLTCSIDANPTDVEFTWNYENNTLKDEHTVDDDEDLSSRVLFHEETGLFGEYQCTATLESLKATRECFLDVTAEGGWLQKLEENKGVFVTAAVIAVLMLILLITIIVCIVKRLMRGKGGTDGEGREDGDRAFYENLPFHGMQPPPNKPFKPILPDLEYADVDFPAKPLNNNNPPYNTKAKIVERVLEEVKDDPSPEKVPPSRPPRTKDARK